MITQKILKEENCSTIECFFELILTYYFQDDSRAEDKFELLSKKQKIEFFEFVHQNHNEVDEAKIISFFEYEHEQDLDFFVEE